MGPIGYAIEIFVLLSAIGASVLYVLALSNKSESYFKIANNVFLASVGLTVVASILLLVALVTSDFSLTYVASYTDLSLPLFYKISAFWAGRAGSLLFWLLLLVLFSAIEIFRLKKQSMSYRAAVYLALSVSSAFFAFLVCFFQNPFEMLDFIQRDGYGMNPMLQNPGMVIHPPATFVGYVGFNVVVAHSFAALLIKNFSSEWIKLSRGWTLITWAFLTAGIVIGGWWAYVELGWGGYWAWDPVENASLFPWLTATALLHSAHVYMRNGKLKAWTFSLSLLTFELTVLGTFITRSGVIDSVHTFGKNPIGNYFLIFIAITAAIYIYYMYKSKRELEDTSDFYYLSREGLVFISNWLFVGVMFVILFGTFRPWITELFSATKTTVELAYFNRVSMPFFMLIILGSGIAPLVSFGKQGVNKFLKLILPAFIFMIVAMVGFFMAGYTLLSPLILVGVSSFAIFAVLYKIFTTLAKGGIKSLKTANTFYGAMFIHLGVILIAFGVTLSAFYNESIDEILEQNTTVALNTSMGDYTLEVGQIHTEKVANYISNYLPIRVTKDGQEISWAYPENRLYNNRPDQTFGEVSYYSMFKGDLYFILSGYDVNQNLVRIQGIFQPLIGWIWAGSILMILAACYGAMNFRREKPTEDTNSK